jgi:23S rRNA pseudouridine1911/1915/1917 synthase
MPEERSFRFDGPPQRLDRFLAGRITTLSRTRLQRLIGDGLVTVDGRPEPPRRLLRDGEAVRVLLPDFTSLPPVVESPVRVLYEDEHLVVVDKPAGLVVHPAGPHREGTLVQLLWPRLATAWGGVVRSGGAPADRPGVVHRLDRGTSGVMVVAKTPAAAHALSRQFADRTVRKVYWALVDGIPAAKGRVESSIGRSRRRPQVMSTEDPGRWAETEYRVLKRFPARGPRGAALVEARPRTGRTHQIRVHLAALGHPILGDKAYGGPALPGWDRPLLHARSLALTHPGTGRRRVWTAPPAADFRRWLEAP